MTKVRTQWLYFELHAVIASTFLWRWGHMFVQCNEQERSRRGVQVTDNKDPLLKQSRTSKE
jgi:hypothetical protein